MMEIGLSIEVYAKLKKRVKEKTHQIIEEPIIPIPIHAVHSSINNIHPSILHYFVITMILVLLLLSLLLLRVLRVPGTILRAIEGSMLQRRTSC